MNRQRLLLFLILTSLFAGVSFIYFSRVWTESRTRFRTGLPVPSDILPEELKAVSDREVNGPPRPPELRPEDPVLYGNDRSPVTVIVFGDFQCEFCADQAAAVDEAVRTLGKINAFRVVWRDLPLVSIHSQAMSAATVGRCAAKQGRFKPMHDLLFTRAEAFNETEYLAFARQLNLNESDFLTCLRDPAIPFQLNRDIELAREHAIVEVPLLFVNGKPISGFVDADTLRQVLSYELERVQSTE
jgi:protein-disulfide isomerase